MTNEMATDLEIGIMLLLFATVWLIAGIKIHKLFGEYVSSSILAFGNAVILGLFGMMGVTAALLQ